MKKNLLAMLLAVIMVAAVIFIAAPATKAETEADITLSADTTETLVIDSDKILNLNGFDATVTINEGVTLTIVDTKFMADDDNWDLSGEKAGTLTVAEGSTGNIKAWEQFGDYKYLAVKSEAGTYSAHPFNIMVSELGVNTYSTKITVGITVIADDVVAALIDAGQFGLRNYSLQGTANADKEYTPHSWMKFGDKNGLKGYVDLTGSLDSTVLTNNLYANVGAYIKLNAGDGEVEINSLSTANVYPKVILNNINTKANSFGETQKDKMVTMLNGENNAHIKAYCGKFLSNAPTWTWVTDTSTLVAGDRIIIVANDPDYDFALSTDQKWLTGKEETGDPKNHYYRGQAAITKNGNTITTPLGEDVQILELEVLSDSTYALKTDDGYLRCYSGYSTNRLQTEATLSDDGHWIVSFTNDGSAILKVDRGTDASGNTITRTVLKYNGSGFNCYETAQQVNIAIYRCDHGHYETWSEPDPINATCLTDGSKTYTCSNCGATHTVPIPATGHDFDETTGECKNDGCDATENTEMATTYYALTSSNVNAYVNGGENLWTDLGNGAMIRNTYNCTPQTKNVKFNTDSYFELQFAENVSKLRINAKANNTTGATTTVEVYACNDGSNYQLVSYKDISNTITDHDFDLGSSYKYIKVKITKALVYAITVNPAE